MSLFFDQNRGRWKFSSAHALSAQPFAPQWAAHPFIVFAPLEKPEAPRHRDIASEHQQPIARIANSESAWVPGVHPGTEPAL